MSYELAIVRSAQKELARVSADAYERIKAAIFSLANNPRPQGCKKLSGRDAWRIRVGEYRVIYEIHDKKLLVLVIHLGHRRQVYR